MTQKQLVPGQTSNQTVPVTIAINATLVCGPVYLSGAETATIEFVYDATSAAALSDFQIQGFVQDPAAGGPSHNFLGSTDWTSGTNSSVPFATTPGPLAATSVVPRVVHIKTYGLSAIQVSLVAGGTAVKVKSLTVNLNQ